MWVTLLFTFVNFWKRKHISTHQKRYKRSYGYVLWVNVDPGSKGGVLLKQCSYECPRRPVRRQVSRMFISNSWITFYRCKIRYSLVCTKDWISPMTSFCSDICLSCDFTVPTVYPRPSCKVPLMAPIIGVYPTIECHFTLFLLFFYEVSFLPSSLFGTLIRVTTFYRAER